MTKEDCSNQSSTRPVPRYLCSTFLLSRFTFIDKASESIGNHKGAGVENTLTAVCNYAPTLTAMFR